MFGSWWYLAARSARVNDLEAQVALFASDRERMAALARQLEELEAGYTQIRGLFGTEEADQPSPLWLPPAAGGRTGSGGDADQNLPTSWPLTVRGFVTQGLLEGGQTHPGLDIAVPAESYVRASGAGTVLEIGQDATYGNYIVIEHGEGYQTLYGHASITLVEADQPVRRNEVIALSGSTGRSTAPHLHFEITKDGTPVDPLDLVREP
jgi:murein DD-endopeptidase MepM/ murein hydrolase activator NlpD